MLCPEGNLQAIATGMPSGISGRKRYGPEAIKELKKTIELISQPPWRFTQAAEYLQRLIDGSCPDPLLRLDVLAAQPAAAGSRAAMPDRAVDTIAPEDVAFAQRTMAAVVVAAAKKSKPKKKLTVEASNEVAGAPVAQAVTRRVTGKRKAQQQFHATAGSQQRGVRRRPAPPPTQTAANHHAL